MQSIDNLFKGRHFEREIIILGIVTLSNDACERFR